MSYLPLTGGVFGGDEGGLWLYKVPTYKAAFKFGAAATLPLPLYLSPLGNFYRPNAEDFAVRTTIDDAGEDNNISIDLWVENSKVQRTDYTTDLKYDEMRLLPSPKISGTQVTHTGAPTYSTIEGSTVGGDWLQLAAYLTGTWTSTITITIELWVLALDLYSSDNPFHVDGDFLGPEHGDLFTDLTARS